MYLILIKLKLEYKNPRYHLEAIISSVKELKKYIQNSEHLAPVQEQKKTNFIFNSNSRNILDDFDKNLTSPNSNSTKIKSELCEREQKYLYCRYTNILYSKLSSTCSKTHLKKVINKSTKSKLPNTHAVNYLFQ